MSLHAITCLRDDELEDDDSKVVTTTDQNHQMGLFNDSDSELEGNGSIGGVPVDEEVELEPNHQFTPTTRVEDLSTSNLLLPEKELNLFIRQNFCCKLRSNPVTEVDLTSVKAGCACSLFWKCSNSAYDASHKIIAKKATQDVSESYQRWHPDIPPCLSDYDINRQIVLLCQVSKGSVQMASRFGGLMSLSHCSIWLDNFTHVEQ
jgi:hypothetical protein